jgi:hypothetical protein
MQRPLFAVEVFVDKIKPQMFLTNRCGFSLWCHLTAQLITHHHRTNGQVIRLWTVSSRSWLNSCHIQTRVSLQHRIIKRRWKLVAKRRSWSTLTDLKHHCIQRICLIKKQCFVSKFCRNTLIIWWNGERDDKPWINTLLIRTNRLDRLRICLQEKTWQRDICKLFLLQNLLPPTAFRSHVTTLLNKLKLNRCLSKPR